MHTHTRTLTYAHMHSHMHTHALTHAHTHARMHAHMPAGCHHNPNLLPNNFHIRKVIPYSGNFSRRINIAVFVDFTATSKILL